MGCAALTSHRNLWPFCCNRKNLDAKRCGCFDAANQVDEAIGQQMCGLYVTNATIHSSTERRPDRPVALYLALLIAAPLLFVDLNTIPGLHGDEAWVGLRAEEIRHGARYFFGMNWYTGSIHQFLAAPLISVFGHTAFALRLVTSIAWLVSVILYFCITRMLFSAKHANISVLLLVTLPCFTAYGRTGWEVCALNPLLALTSIWLVLKGLRSTANVQVLYSVLAGVCLAIGCWNHLIFVSVPIALAVVVVTNCRLKVFHHPVFLWVLAVLVVFGLVWLYSILKNIQGSNSFAFPMQKPTDTQSLFHRLIDWPLLFLTLAHGDLLFQRYTGEVLFPTPNLLGILLVAAFLIWSVILFRKASRFSVAGKNTAVFLLSLFFVTVVICPKDSDRYFLLLLLFVPILLSCAFATIIGVFELRPSLAKLLFCLLIWIQLARIIVNYFVAFDRTGGVASSFFEGSKLDTSNHFIRSDYLYKELSDRKASLIKAEPLIAWPLKYYDLDQHQFSSVIAVTSRVQSVSATLAITNTYYVIYSGGQLRVGREICPDCQVTYEDTHFLILEPKQSNNSAPQLENPLRK